MTEIKVDVRISEMDKDMVKSVVDVTAEALQRFTVDRDIASHIKHEFDWKYGVLWHCVVGKDYGSYVSYSGENMIYFYAGHRAILLFRTSDCFDGKTGRPGIEPETPRMRHQRASQRANSTSWPSCFCTTFILHITR
ncbi:hypothetical protein CRM22_010013 [Opisthorchis felineus]|uniref:Dynein light chain n=1 Tax=Opisthorchis felineus TaxID=147828 RepID=A0A4S2L2Y3_OPIFE|nr:hypothetical protein CRM22_010013 [Opisthorchis felineus]